MSKRIDAGDYTAFRDAAKLPPEVAVPFLERYARLNGDGDSPTRHAAAAAELKNVPGIVPYLEKRLTQASHASQVDEWAFNALTRVNTREAVAVVAPYLFDFTTPPSSGDSLKSTNAVSAMLTIAGMKVDNPPTGKIDGDMLSRDIVLWQRWAVEHQLVPREWKSRIGQGEWLRQMSELERTLK